MSNNETEITPSLSLECQKAVERFGDLLDGEVTPTEKQAITSHLEDCPSCAAFYGSYRDVVASAALLREEDQKPLPVDIHNRLRQALNQRLGINLPYVA